MNEIFRQFLAEQHPDVLQELSSGYGLAGVSADAAHITVQKFRGHSDISEQAKVELLASAREIALEFFDICAAPKTSLAYVLSHVNMKASAGYPFKGTKKDALDHEWDEVYKRTMSYWTDKPCKTYVKVSPKYEVLPTNKLLYKERNFEVCDLALYLAAAVLIYGQLDNTHDNWFRLFMRLGISRFLGKMASVLALHAKKDITMECDFAGMEYCWLVIHFLCILLIRLSWLLSEDSNDKEALKRVYEAACNSDAWCTCGKTFCRCGVMPSGFLGTGDDTSLLSSILLLSAWKKLCPDPSRRNIKAFRDAVELSVVGDNVLISVDYNDYEWFHFDAIWQCIYREYGFWLKLENLCKPGDDITFCSMRYSQKFCKVVSNKPKKILSRLLYTESYSEHVSEVYSGVYNELAYTEYHSLLVDFGTYLRNMGVRVNVLPSEELELLYSGVLKVGSDAPLKLSVISDSDIIRGIVNQSMGKKKNKVRKEEKKIEKKMKSVVKKDLDDKIFKRPVMTNVTQNAGQEIGKLVGVARKKRKKRSGLKDTGHVNERMWVAALLDPWNNEPARFPDGEMSASGVMKLEYTTTITTVSSGSYIWFFSVQPSLKNHFAKAASASAGTMTLTYYDHGQQSAIDGVAYQYRVTALSVEFMNRVALTSQQGSGFGGLLLNQDFSSVDVTEADYVNTNGIYEIPIIDTKPQRITWRPAAPTAMSSSSGTTVASGLSFRDPATAVGTDNCLCFYASGLASGNGLQVRTVMHIEFLPIGPSAWEFDEKVAIGGLDGVSHEIGAAGAALEQKGSSWMTSILDVVSGVANLIADYSRWRRGHPPQLITYPASSPVIEEAVFKRHRLCSILGRPEFKDGTPCLGKAYWDWLKDGDEVIRHCIGQLMKMQRAEIVPDVLVAIEEEEKKSSGYVSVSSSRGVSPARSTATTSRF